MGGVSRTVVGDQRLVISKIRIALELVLLGTEH
jgi:hypothetical protein